MLMEMGTGKTITSIAVSGALYLSSKIKKILVVAPLSILGVWQEEFAKFVADYNPEEAAAIPAIRNFFKAYITQDTVRNIIDNREYTDLATHPAFTTKDFKAVPAKYRALVPEYVRDYVTLNQFA